MWVLICLMTGIETEVSAEVAAILFTFGLGGVLMLK